MATSLRTKASSAISPHPETEYPSTVWRLIKRKVGKKAVEPLDLDTPVHPDRLRFVVMSDTHNKETRYGAQSWHRDFGIPPGDVFLHAGDFTNVGKIDEIKRFNNFLGSLPHKFVVVIAGNHELSIGRASVDGKPTINFDLLRQLAQPSDQSSPPPSDPRTLITNAIYLEDSGVEIGGVRIWGSPWQPVFGGWAFNLVRGATILKKWDAIPEETDILVTHGPPLGFGDKVKGGNRVGCVELLETVRRRVKPAYHVFGHIHEDYGCWNDGQTTYINASTCDILYNPCNPPVVFDVPLLEGLAKADLEAKAWPAQCD